MGEKEKHNEDILKLVGDYNSLCASAMLNHRFKYNSFNEQLVLANREQLSYGSYQCELAKGIDNVKEFVKSAIRVICFEHGE